MDSSGSEQSDAVEQPADQLQAEWEQIDLKGRFLLSLYMCIGAFGGFYGGHVLLTQFRHWFAWALSLLVLDPVGLVSVLGLVMVTFPRSRLACWAARMFSSALGRAKLAAILVGLVFGAAGLFVVGALLYALWLNYLR